MNYVSYINDQFLFPFSNWGTETDPDAKYHNGNSEPRGFGNIYIMHVT